MAADLITDACYLSRTSNPPATAAPLTLSTWLYFPTLQGFASMAVLLTDAGAPTANMFGLQFGDAGGFWNAYAFVQNSAGTNGNAIATSVAPAAAGVWVHACAVFTSATSRAAYVNGLGKGTDTTSVTPTGIVETDIGGYVNASGVFWMADVAVWNVALSDAEVLALGRGMSPLAVRPSGLQAYWPLETPASATLNRIRGTTDRTLTISRGSVIQAGGPPIIGGRYYAKLRSAQGTSRLTGTALVGNGFAVASPALGTPLAAARSVLVAPDLAPASPSLGAAGLAQGHALAASGLVPASPSIAAPAVKQAHALLASAAVAGAPALDAPAANQRAVLTASAFAASSPVMASGFVAQAGVLASVPVAVGSPIIGAPAFNQSAALAASALAASSPVFTAPAVTLVLSAAGLAVGSPVLPAAAVTQVVALVPVGKTVTSPAVGTATLAQAHTFLTLFEPQLSIGPTVDLAFAYRRTDASQIAVTRAVAAYVDDARGNWSLVPVHTPRISDKGLLIEESITNYVPNSSWQGAVVGGALPSLWSFATGTLTREVVGLGVEANGVEYIDLRLSGPAGGIGPWVIRAPSTAIASGAGAPWSASAWFKLIAGNFSGFNGTPPLTLRIADEGGGTQFTPDGNWTRITNSRLLATNTLGQWCLRFATIDAVTPIDVTIRIGWPQVENFASARSPVRTTTAAVGKPADLVALVTPPGSFPASGGLFVEYSVPRAPISVAGNHYLLQVSDGSASNRALLYLSFTNPNNKRFVVSNAAVSQGDVAVVGAYPYNDAIGRLAARFIDNDMRSAADGTLSAADNACIVPTNFTSLNIGGASPFTTAMDGYIRRLKYFNQPPTDNDLQLLTGGPGVSSPVLGAGSLGQKHVLVPVGITTSPAVTPAATFAQENALEAVDKTVGAPVLGVSTITGQGHALLPPAFSESSPVLGVGTLKQKQVLAATAAAAGHPVLGVGLFVQAGTCVASPLATSAPQFGVAGIKQVHAIAAPRLSLSSGPIVGSSKAVIKAPPLFAANLVVQSPNISPLRPTVGFTNLLAIVPDFHAGKIEFTYPDAELIAPPEVFFRCKLDRWSREVGAKFYDDDNTQFGRPVKQAIFANMNDALDLILSSGTLAGRTSRERGPAEDIIVGAPLWLADKKLRIDWSEVDQLRDDVNALMAAVTINTDVIAAHTAALAAATAQQAINVAAIATNTALLVALQADLQKLLRQLKTFIPRDLVAGAPILGTPRAATRLPAATNLVVTSPVLGHPTLVRLTI